MLASKSFSFALFAYAKQFSIANHAKNSNEQQHRKNYTENLLFHKQALGNA